MPIRAIHLAMFALALSVPASGAGAGEAKPDNGLPGVSGGYAIVAPAPPRREDDADGEKGEGRGTSFQAGAFEVTVTGSVSVEIGLGHRPAGGRR
jgi:hypothetical protein